MNTTATAMSSLERLLAQPLLNAVGWALVHFVWQGAAVAAVVAVLLAVLRRASANVRYLVACGVLLVLACMPIVTAWCVVPQPPTRPKTSTDRTENLSLPATERDGARGAPLREVLVELPAEPDSLPVATAPLGNPSSPPDRPLRTRAAEWIECALPWLVAAWLVGVLGLSARLLAGWAHVQRIRRRHARPAAEPWPARLAELARRLRVTRPVRLFESAIVEVPIVIGWLRPVILLPASALVGLTPHQLEALLAHELAHIRRQDYLVNLLQTIVETLLFYHPAVWWVSHRIRAEREECCDDLAVSICGDRVVYARALASMEEIRAMRPQLVVAANGGPLLNRIRRLLGVPAPRSNPAIMWLAGLIVLAAGVAWTAHVIGGPRESAPAHTFSPWGDATHVLDDEKPEGRILVAANPEPPRLYEPSTSIVSVNPQTGAWEKLVDRAWLCRVAPNGADLAYLQADELWIRNPDGQARKALDFRGWPRWLPDGQSLLFTRAVPPDGSWKYETWRVHLDGAPPEKLEIPEDVGINDISPDGKWFVAMVGRRSGAGCDLYLVRDNGTERRLLSQPNGWNVSARFSPDGQHVLYTHHDGDETSPVQETLWIVDVEAKTRKLVITDPGVAVRGCWSPDGTRLALVMWDWNRDESGKTKGHTNHRIETADRHGGDRRQLNTRPLTFWMNSEPAWIPSSQPGRSTRLPREQGQGPESGGLQCRLIGVSPNTPEEFLDLPNRLTEFTQADDMTFVVELKNVSDQAIKLLGVRYGDNVSAPWPGKRKSDWFAPLLFDCEFFDENGRPVDRADRKLLGADAALATDSRMETIEPGKTLTVLIRPAQWSHCMEHRLAPGTYRVRVHYRGPNAEVVETLRRIWPDRPAATAWSGDVVSGDVTFTIADDPARKRPELLWGEPKDGLVAAIEFVVPASAGRLPPEGGTTNTYPHGTKLNVRVHVKNVSDRTVQFWSEAWRQGDKCTVRYETGVEQQLGGSWYTGWTNMIHWTLKPGQVAELPLPDFGVAADAESAEKFAHPIGPVLVAKPGKYGVRYELRFDGIQRKDKDGNVVVPGKDDWQGTITTDETSLAVRAAAPEDPARLSPAASRILGRVIDTSGDPVARAEIFAFTREARPAAISADDGRFQLEVPLQEVPGLMLRATRDDGDRQAFHQLPYEQNQPPEDVSIVMRPARQVVATIMDANNEPVGNSWVAVVSGGRKFAEATTDATGRATLRVPADAPLQYALARKPGMGLDYFVYRRKDEPPSDPYKLPSDHGEPLRFVLNGTRTVTVRVLDSQQQPLVGVRVYPWYFEKPQKGGNLNCSGVEEFASLSDSRGIATFPFTPADNTGNVTFWVGATAYFAPERPMWDPKSRDDKVIANLVSMVKVRGSASFTDGRPAADIEIKVAGSGYQVDGFHGSTRTTEDGKFESLVYPNQYYSFLPASDRWSAATQRMVVRESDRDGIIFVLQPATRVFGRLTIGADKPMARQFLVLYQSDYGEEYHKLPESERLPNPNDSRKAIMSLVGRNTYTDDDGRFEFFAGPGRYYIIGPNNVEAPKFEIADQKTFEINLHASQPDRGEISGRVVLQSDRSRGVREARVTGVPMQTRMRRLDAVTDPDGRFRAERGLSEMIVHAATADRKLAGIVKLSADENSVEIPIGPTAMAHGRLLDEATGVPLPDKRVEYGVFIKYGDGTFNWRFGGTATTDNNGEFSLTGLVVGWDYALQVVTEFDSDGRSRSFRRAGTVNAERAELVEIGDIKFNSSARERPGPPELKESVPEGKRAAKESSESVISPEKRVAGIESAGPQPEATASSAKTGGSQTRPQPPAAAQLPGRLFVGAGLRTTEDETRFSQLAIAIDPNTGSWTRLQNLSEAGGFTVPLSPVRVSPDGRTMLFMREKELWKCDARTGDRPERVLEKGSPAAWSPDGKAFVAVVSKKESDYQAVENWKVSADGGDHSVLALRDADVVEDWSPDGQWLAVTSRKDGQLYVVKPDGSGRRRITDSDTNASRNDHPRFSPDSRRIVYHRTLYIGEDGSRESHFSLRTIHIDGTGDREILGEKKAGPEPDSAVRTAPMGARWSPDGKHLAVVLFDHSGGGILAINGNWRLAIIDADGGNLRELKLEGVLNTVLPWDGPEWRLVPDAEASTGTRPSSD